MRTCLSIVRAVLAVALGIQVGKGAAVTVYRVSQPVFGTPPAGISVEEQGVTRTVFAIGPGANGMTQYVQEEVISLLVNHAPDTTITYISAPTTISYTFEENASVLHASNPPAIQTGTFGDFEFEGIVQNCTLDVGKQTGTCVEEFKLPQLVPLAGSGSSQVFSTRTLVATQSYTAALIPVATVTTSGASPFARGRRGVGSIILAGVVGMLGLL
ncbi:hypothetical protein GALMADRAFT_137185 [Galerina marginata CBS 339.88]|uniref:Uncharacterized protein n=1 Tax=Galerina marginata (strain CBS 339.88) TaxID=685588 RepID=A0A067T878_GALM3|nr:hypothetical protein GALMADRAFT_137185 [Galerina marginata CBS 339.88]